MKTQTLLSVARRLASPTCGIIHFDVSSAGSSSRYVGAFPSIDEDTVAMMGDAPFVIEYDTPEIARHAFNRVCADFADTYDSLIGGRILLVETGRTVEFDLDDDSTYPVASAEGVTREPITALL